MKWTLRDPSIFPIHFADVVESAYASQSPKLLSKVRDLDTARSYLDVFRHWRYCLRNHNSNQRGRKIELTCRIRTYTREALISGINIYLEVHPDLIKTIFDLNPHLRDLGSNLRSNVNT